MTCEVFCSHHQNVGLWSQASHPLPCREHTASLLPLHTWSHVQVQDQQHYICARPRVWRGLPVGRTTPWNELARRSCFPKLHSSRPDWAGVSQIPKSSGHIVRNQMITYELSRTADAPSQRSMGASLPQTHPLVAEAGVSPKERSHQERSHGRTNPRHDDFVGDVEQRESPSGLGGAPTREGYDTLSRRQQDKDHTGLGDSGQSSKKHGGSQTPCAMVLAYCSHHAAPETGPPNCARPGQRSRSAANKDVASWLAWATDSQEERRP